MSGLVRPKTKKVTTYGRSATRVVNVHSDLSPSANAPPSPMLNTPVKRPVLASKLSRDYINIPLTPTVDTKGKVKVKAAVKDDHALVYDTTVDSPVFIRRPAVHARRPGRAIISPSPATSPAVQKTLARPLALAQLAKYESSDSSRQREIIDAVEIPTRPSSSRRLGPLHRRQVKREVSVERDEGVDISPQHLSLADVAAADAVPATPSPSKSMPSASSSATQPSASQRDCLRPLQEVCTSPDTLTYDRLLNALGNSMRCSPCKTAIRMSKIGEATYSDVYRAAVGEETIVVKIVPLAMGRETESGNNVPEVTRPEDVAKEVSIGQRMSAVSSGGFIGYHGSYIVKDFYTREMLAAWDAFQKEWPHDSHNPRPSCFGTSQLYLVMLLEDGGWDLECTAFDKDVGWRQATSVFWQVVRALADAEKNLEFEHRDLHEGQILITAERLPDKAIQNFADPSETGINAKIIDFGLSRLRNADGSIHNAVPDDILNGVGTQWDVYREMHAEAKGDWEAYRPQTNLRWLRYIATFILNDCPSLNKPRTAIIRPGTRPGKATIANRRELEAYATLLEAKDIMDAAFEAPTKAKRSSRKPIKQEGLQAMSAQGLFEWACAKGWVA